jgi:hypothetical protein
MSKPTIAVTIEIRDDQRVEYWRGKPVEFTSAHMQTAANESYDDAITKKAHAASIMLDNLRD